MYYALFFQMILQDFIICENLWISFYDGIVIYNNNAFKCPYFSFKYLHLHKNFLRPTMSSFLRRRRGGLVNERAAREKENGEH